MADVITFSRILISIVMLFSEPFSLRFYLLYSLAGISDMLDGHVAWMTGTAGDTGSNLDSIADFTFLICSAVKILPGLIIKKVFWFWIVFISVIKLINLIIDTFCIRRTAALHTKADKAAGLIIFLFPFVLNCCDINAAVIVCCTAATFAALYDLSLLLNEQNYSQKKK